MNYPGCILYLIVRIVPASFDEVLESSLVNWHEVELDHLCHGLSTTICSLSGPTEIKDGLRLGVPISAINKEKEINDNTG